ncbi:Lipase 4 [Yarrowia sp. B02]|nr:Lipase 4 [Yarrowia sp. B02]
MFASRASKASVNLIPATLRSHVHFFFAFIAATAHALLLMLYELLGDGYLKAFVDSGITLAQQSGLSGIVNALTSEAKLRIDKRSIIKKLLEDQENSESYFDWLKASSELDYLLGNQEWKEKDECPAYDYEYVRLRLDELRHARTNNDTTRLLYLVRTTWSRNLGNLGDVKLYHNSFTGTKRLIEDYILECELALNALLAAGNDKIPDQELLTELLNTRKSFGRTALLLSGGGCLGLLHTGVLQALSDTSLLPHVISGSSAGSIMAAGLCIHKDEEHEAFISELMERDFDIFEESGNEDTVLERISRMLKHGSLLDNRYMQDTMRDLFGDMTFLEAYNRTRRILNVTVSSAGIYEMPRLLNYLTAPNVLIWSAVCASCSVPLIFNAYTLLEKEPKTGAIQTWNASSLRFIDGSVYADVPIARLSEMFNVNHFIVSQVNPHVAPFLKLTEDKANPDSVDEIYTLKLWHNFKTLVTDEVMHQLQVLYEFGIFKNLCSKVGGVLSQRYKGDITILPQVHLSELPGILTNPTAAYMKDTNRRGAQATYRKISLIRNHCAIELALDRAIHELKARMLPSKLGSGRTSPQGTFKHSQSSNQISALKPPSRHMSASAATSAHTRLRNRKSFSHARIKSDAAAVFDKDPHETPRSSPQSSHVNLHRSASERSRRPKSAFNLGSLPTSPLHHPHLTHSVSAGGVNQPPLNQPLHNPGRGSISQNTSPGGKVSGGAPSYFDGANNVRFHWDSDDDDVRETEFLNNVSSSSSRRVSPVQSRRASVDGLRNSVGSVATSTDGSLSSRPSRAWESISQLFEGDENCSDSC